MSIASQFAGLDMKQLIGGPLTAAADASTLLANSTADFINRVGFDADGKVRTVAFGYQKQSMNEDGTSNLDEMVVNVPMLAIVPIPNLQVDEVNILFDMEVKQSEKSEQSLDVGASLSGSLNLGIVKVSISGSVSVHQNNTRSSDNSAKYHVDVRATNHGTPEGLARVLDMMAANVAPALAGSTIRDENGQSLPEASRAKAERLKKLRQEISRIETRLSAARTSLDDTVTQLKRIGGMQQNIYHAETTRFMNGLDKTSEEDTRLAAERERKMESVTQSWNDLQNQASGIVRMIADGGEENLQEVSELFALLAWKDNEVQKYAEGEKHYEALRQIQNNAVAAQKAVAEIEKELFDKRAEYSDAVSGVDTKNTGA